MPLIRHAFLPIFLLVAFLLISACNILPPAPSPSENRASPENFFLRARFVLRYLDEYLEEKSIQGQLQWQHQKISATHTTDALSIFGPLDTLIVEIQSDSAGAWLKDRQGKIYHAPNLSLLLEKQQMPLPVDALPQWIFGQGEGEKSNDDQGRIRQRLSGDWQIDYHYDHAAPSNTTAHMLNLHNKAIQLKLRVDALQSFLPTP